MIHDSPHPLAGKTVLYDRSSILDPDDVVAFHIEDYWDRVAGKSWMDCAGNLAALMYAIRATKSLPIDDEVLYGKIGPFGHLVHVSELGEVVEE